MSNASSLSVKSASFMAMNPTLVGIVAGVSYYECPYRGDESPLRYIDSEGKLRTSDYWELEDIVLAN